MSEETAAEIVGDLMTVALMELQEGTYERCAKICDETANRYFAAQYTDHRNLDRGFGALACAREIRKAAKNEPGS